MKLFTDEFRALLGCAAAEKLETIRPTQVAEALQKFLESLNTGQNTVLQADNSTVRGQKGETWVADLLRTQLGLWECDVERVGHQGHQGDLQIVKQYRGRKLRVLIDVKNYTRPVPQDELDKFVDDIHSTGCDAAMMLSLGTRIVGAQEHPLQFGHTELADKRCRYALLSTAEPALIVHMVKVLWSMAAGERMQHGTANVDYLGDALGRMEQDLALLAGMRQGVVDMEQHFRKDTWNLQRQIGNMESRMHTHLRQMWDSLGIDTHEKWEHGEDAERLLEQEGVLKPETLRLVSKYGVKAVDSSGVHKKIQLHTVNNAVIHLMKLKDKFETVMPEGFVAWTDVQYTVKNSVITFSLDEHSGAMAERLLA